MSVSACAERVRLGDPDRFLATMTGPPEARARLFVLSAFNLELARAPNVAREPLIAQMRLAFWQEVVDEAAARQPPRAHEVARPLAELIAGAQPPPREALDEMIAARMAEAEGAMPPVPDFARQTGGALMRASGRALGAPEAADAALTALGTASGLANWLMALPRLRHRPGFAMPGAAEVEDLAREGLARLGEARAAPELAEPALAPALRSAWRAPVTLARALRAPERALEGRLETSELRRRGDLLWRSLRGGW